MKLIHLSDPHHMKERTMSMADVCPAIRMGCR